MSSALPEGFHLLGLIGWRAIEVVDLPGYLQGVGEFSEA